MRRGSVRPSVLPLEDRQLLATFTVTTTTDNDTTNGDTGSLRAAIIALDKSTDKDNTIAFNIPGSGVQTIDLKADLPEITQPVTINGYTQPGSHANTLGIGNNAVLLIELNGAGATSVGLNISAGDSTVEGLVLNRFPGNAIELRSLGGNKIVGNFIGTNATGTAALPNGGSGVSILENTSLSDDVHFDSIGGPASADRNIISGNGTNGVSIDMNDPKATAPGKSAPSFNQVQGNYIGTDVTGTKAIGNGANGVFINASASNQILGNVISGNAIGVQIGGLGSSLNGVTGNFIGTDPTGMISVGNGVGINVGDGASGNTIGGTTAMARNVISGNQGSGLTFTDGTDPTEQNKVQGNFIGTKADGLNALGNGADGILLLASDQMIGGTDAGEANVIAFNGGAGVNVSSGSGNTILSNSIFANHVGIVLGSGANHDQAAPVLTSVTSTSGGTLVRGTLTSTPNTSLTIQFFATPNTSAMGTAQGQKLIGTATVFTNSSGVATLAILLPGSFPFGQNVTATATTTPANNTSSFSNAINASVTAADVGVYIPATDTFALAFLNPNAFAATPFSGQSVFQYGGHSGNNFSVPITGDFNGDGISDVGIYVPSTDTFALAFLNAQGQVAGQRVFQYGTHVGGTPSVPVTGDFNGDGVTDVGVYLPTADTFALAFLDPNPSSASPFLGQNVFQYGGHSGNNFLTPITGDFNGDGTTDVGLFIPTNDTFALTYLNPHPTDTTGSFLGQKVFPYGSNAGGVNSEPVTGDFNGDGITDVGIYAPVIDTFALAFLNVNPDDPSNFLGQSVFPYGSHSGNNFSVPITGDFNGDAVTDVGIYAPTTNLFALVYLNGKTNGTTDQFVGQRVFNYGTSAGGVNSVPITGDFTGPVVTPPANPSPTALESLSVSAPTPSSSSSDVHALSVRSTSSASPKASSTRFALANLPRANKARLVAGSALPGRRGSIFSN